MEYPESPDETSARCTPIGDVLSVRQHREQVHRRAPGHHLGAVRAWVRLQDEHECLFSVVDLHAITQPYEPAALAERTREMALSLLAAGLDPARCILFVQSHVSEHTELNWLLTTVTPLGELERQTQFKDKAQRQESVPAGLLNYPVLQAADVLLLIEVADTTSSSTATSRSRSTREPASARPGSSIRAGSTRPLRNS